MKKLLCLSSVLLLFLISNNLFAQIQSNGAGGGNWNAGASWQGGTAPGAGDDAVILDSDIITLNADITVLSLTINVGGTLNQNNNRELTLTGNLTNNGSFISNESGGDVDVIMMTGAGATLDGSGTFDMNVDGRFEFKANTTIAASADLLVYASSTQENLMNIDNGITVTNNGSITIEEDLSGDNASGSIWVNAANSTLVVGDDLLTTGTLTATATGNTVEYNESEDVNIKTPSSSQYYNLVASGSKIKTIQADLTILNDLTISSTLASGGNNITIQGDWTNTGNFTEGSGLVTFNGSNDQSITSSIEEDFNDLTVDMSASTLTLNSDVRVAGTMDIDNVIISTGSNSLTLGTGTGQTGTLTSTSASTIVGKFNRWVNSTATQILYPIGTSSDYRPVNISFDNLTGGTLEGEFISSTPGSLTSPPLDDAGFGLNNMHLNGYWSFTKANGLVTTKIGRAHV